MKGNKDVIPACTVTQPTSVVFQPPFQTIEQAAKTLGVSNYYLRQLKTDKRLPGFEVGNKYYVDVTSLWEQLHALSERGTDTIE